MTRLFYGWRMSVAAGAMQFLQATLLMQAFGAYVAVLHEKEGWSKTALSGAAAMQQVEAAVLGPLVGWILDRFGAPMVIRFGVVMLGCGFMLLSFAETLPGFYGAFIVVALGSSLCGFFPLNVSLINWFQRHRARALSSLQFGLSLGGIAVPLVAWSLTSFGWRATAFGSGVLILLVMLPISLVIRSKPENYGLRMDGDAAPAAAVAQDVAATPASALAPREGERDFTVREAMRTPAFWLLALGHGSSLLVVGAVNVHAISHMKEGLGYSIEAASLMITLMTIGQFTGTGLSLVLGHRYDQRMIISACMMLHMAGLLFLTYATNTAMVVLFTIMHGIAWGLRGSFMSSIRADYFGRTSIGMILGLSSLVVLIGQVGGPLIAGGFADATGNYRIGFTVVAVLAGLGSIFFLTAKKPAFPRAG